MLSGIESFTGQFLADLNNIEARIGKATKQISSGLRVQQASDDPAAVPAILSYQQEITRITQVQTNLNTAKTLASTADGVLQTVAQMMDQLTSVAAQGANSTTTTATRQILAGQVQQLEQQMVTLANSTLRGKYVFGGDAPDTTPYTFDWTSAKGVVSNVTTSSTSTLEDASGNQIVPSMTAQQIFDTVDPVTGAPTSGNIFNAVYSLGLALQADNQPAVEAAAQLLKSANDQLGQATVFYGNTQNWIDGGLAYTTQHLTDLQGSLSQARDADIASLATQLTMDKTAMDASLAAHANLGHKSLFDYLG